MKQINIDDDIYDFLREQVRDFEETPSTVLRRLLNLNKSGPPLLPTCNSPKAPLDAPKSPNSALSPDIAQLIERLAGSGYHTVVDRFLDVLSFLCRRNPEGFSKVLEMRGNGRIYFSKSPQEIERSGASTQPKQIPATEYWVVTNNDTQRKKRMLVEVMQRLGYSKADIEAVCTALDATPAGMEELKSRTEKKETPGSNQDSSNDKDGLEYWKI